MQEERVRPAARLPVSEEGSPQKSASEGLMVGTAKPAPIAAKTLAAPAGPAAAKPGPAAAKPGPAAAKPEPERPGLS